MEMVYLWQWDAKVIVGTVTTMVKFTLQGLESLGLKGTLGRHYNSMM